MNPLIIQQSPSPVISSLLGPNILLNILFSNPLVLQIKFHRHTKQVKMIVLFNIYIFRQQMGRYRNKKMTDNKHSPTPVVFFTKFLYFKAYLDLQCQGQREVLGRGTSLSHAFNYNGLRKP
jgi:hypothetical protein